MTTIREAFPSPVYVALETPATQRLVWAYRYWRQQGEMAARALFFATADVGAGRTRYPMRGSAGYGNVPFKVRSFENIRWIENPRAAGLRFVGYADEIARLRHTGWFTDEDQCEKVRGVVFQIAGRDGKPRYVPGFDNETGGAADRNGPCAICFEEIFTDAITEHAAVDCAERADDLAQYLAEDEREYRAASNAGVRYSELAEEIATVRKRALVLLSERRAAVAQSNGMSFPAICATIADQVRGIWREIHSMRKERAELLNQYGHKQAFIDG